MLVDSHEPKAMVIFERMECSFLMLDAIFSLWKLEENLFALGLLVSGLGADGNWKQHDYRNVTRYRRRPSLANR